MRGRIDALRAALRTHGLAAWLLPSADPHLSEYLPERWQGREWLSRLHRLDGHAGGRAPTAPALFADSRYWVQAEAELAGTGIELVKIPTGSLDAARRLAGRARAGAAQWSAVDGQVLGAGRGRGAAATALDAARRRAAHRPRPARRRLARAPRRCPRRRSTSTRAPHAPTPRARQAGRGARGDGARTAPRTTSSPRVDDIAWITNLRGSRRRLQPGVPGPPAGRRRAARRCSSATARSTPALAARAGRRRHRAGALRARPAPRWPRWPSARRC
ncbi:MAG: hypothetical protein MZW92_07430 [Comamonadaceae bacterium]|nr:hypothetical protein [Comamonadaceae bacterium]